MPVVVFHMSLSLVLSEIWQLGQVLVQIQVQLFLVSGSEAVLRSSIGRYMVSGFPVCDVSSTCLNSWQASSWWPCLLLACCGMHCLSVRCFLGLWGGVGMEAGSQRLCLLLPALWVPETGEQDL